MRFGPITACEVAQDHPRRDRLHAHEVHGRAAPGRRVVEELAHEPAGPHARLLRARRARLLDVEEQRVGARRARSPRSALPDRRACRATSDRHAALRPTLGSIGHDPEAYARGDALCRSERSPAVGDRARHLAVRVEGLGLRRRVRRQRGRRRSSSARSTSASTSSTPPRSTGAAIGDDRRPRDRGPARRRVPRDQVACRSRRSPRIVEKHGRASAARLGVERHRPLPDPLAQPGGPDQRADAAACARCSTRASCATSASATSRSGAGRPPRTRSARRCCRTRCSTASRSASPTPSSCRTRPTTTGS